MLHAVACFLHESEKFSENFVSFVERFECVRDNVTDVAQNDGWRFISHGLLKNVKLNAWVCPKVS